MRMRLVKKIIIEEKYIVRRAYKNVCSMECVYVYRFQYYPHLLWPKNHANIVSNLI